MTAVDAPIVLRRKWFQECESSSNHAPNFSEQGEELQAYLWKMWLETRLHIDLLRERGIPISTGEEWAWTCCLENPFKCPRCTARGEGAIESNNCCPTDDYRWVRDTRYIDVNDYQRMLRYCPPLPLTPEPPEWRDGDDPLYELATYAAASSPL